MYPYPEYPVKAIDNPYLKKLKKFRIKRSADLDSRGPHIKRSLAILASCNKAQQLINFSHSESSFKRPFVPYNSIEERSKGHVACEEDFQHKGGSPR